MQVYQRIKRWEPCLEEWARTRGEVGKLGALVIEPYLDESSERLGRIILTQCRAGCLPLMARVREEEALPAAWGGCLMCQREQEETLSHFLLYVRLT